MSEKVSQRYLGIPKSPVKQLGLVLPRIQQIYKPFPQVIGQEKLQDFKKELSPKIIKEIIWGFYEGRDWVLKRFNWKGEKVPLEITTFEEYKDGFFVYSMKDKRVKLNIDYLKNSCKYVKSLYQKYDFGPWEAPKEIHPLLTIGQQSKAAGVHESVHFLAHNNISGLTPISD